MQRLQLLSPTTTQATTQVSGWKDLLRRGTVIPAHPLALTADGKLDVQRQRALTRYYCAAGAGGIAVGVHTTQFEIHDPAVGLLRPVLKLAAETADAYLQTNARPFVKVAGITGKTAQAVSEAQLARDLGYHAGLLSLAAFTTAGDDELIHHVQAVADVIPVIGFYLQPAVGGRVLPYSFWRRFVEIDNVVAIKVAPFNRYQTLDVARAVASSGRNGEIALYTGNDDNIVADLITEFDFGNNGVPYRGADNTDTGDANVIDEDTVAADGSGHGKPVCFSGGLLGQWAVWTHSTVEMLRTIHEQRATDTIDYKHWLRYGVQLTDANAAIFDVANGFRGCIPGIHQVLVRQNLMAGTQTLNPEERLSPGQAAEIARVSTAYPHLTDDAFVAEHLQEWLEG
jgi:dihydrodipicolinate synthase/N-acetylneuraminate lyase